MTTVIVDDGGYGMLRFDQRRAGTPPYGVDLRTPDFVALAESFGVRAEAVDGLEDDFSAALAPPRRRRRADGPGRPRGARAAADDVAALVSAGDLSARIVEHGASPLAVRRADGPKNPAVAPKTVGFGQFGLPRNFP